ncbi:hypothetical protein ACWGVR_33885 [Streptomyces xanthophaeus]
MNQATLLGEAADHGLSERGGATVADASPHTQVPSIPGRELQAGGDARRRASASGLPAEAALPGQED